MKQDKTISKTENLFAASRFVLPEHRELYLQLKEEQLRYTPPILDEQEKAELSQLVWEGFQQKCTMRLFFYDGREAQEAKGLIAHIDQGAGKVKLMTLEGTCWISFAELLKAELLEAGS